MSEHKMSFSTQNEITTISIDQVDEVKNPFVRKILNNVIVEGCTHSLNDFSFGEGFQDA